MNEINSKTGNIDKISIIDPDIKSKFSQQKGDGSFDKILTNQIDKGSRDTSSASEKKLQEIDGTFNVQKINLALDKTQFAQKLESSINLLESYAKMLQDPDKTLKQAWSTLEQLTSGTKTLEQEFKDHNFSNSELKSILTQLLATVEVENIKFARGDYT
ncbi:MAG: hypothetical protein GY857_20440 [Desulfobacula sp.]|nr:hypothetical protein [Desulfobacula sp.]